MCRRTLRSTIRMRLLTVRPRRRGKRRRLPNPSTNPNRRRNRCRPPRRLRRPLKTLRRRSPFPIRESCLPCAPKNRNPRPNSRAPYLPHSLPSGARRCTIISQARRKRRRKRRRPSNRRRHRALRRLRRRKKHLRALHRLRRRKKNLRALPRPKHRVSSKPNRPDSTAADCAAHKRTKTKKPKAACRRVKAYSMRALRRAVRWRICSTTMTSTAPSPTNLPNAFVPRSRERRAFPRPAYRKNPKTLLRPLPRRAR